MSVLKLNIENILKFVSKESVYHYEDEIKNHISSLHNKTGKGNDFLGWLDLPSSVSETVTDVSVLLVGI